MSSSRSQSRARFEGETRYSSAGGAAVQERLGRGRSDLPYSGREPEMSGGVSFVPVSQDVAPAVAGGARGTRKNFFGYVFMYCHNARRQRCCAC